MRHAAKVDRSGGKRPISRISPASSLPLLPLFLTILLCCQLSGADASKTNYANLEKHWSFVPPVALASPVLPDGRLPENPIDGFILGKLHELNIRQAGPAS